MSEENKNNAEGFEVSPAEVNNNIPDDGNSDTPKKQISISTFVCSSIALCLAAVMLTVTICNSIFKIKLAGGALGGGNGIPMDTSEYAELAILDMIFKTYTFENVDDEKVKEQLLKAYVAATGDKFAMYYTMEEYNEMVQSSMLGNSVGVGIKIIEVTISVGGTEYKAMKVVDVVKDSPAQKAGVLPGDCVVAIGNADDNKTLNYLGYDTALGMLRGEKGTAAEFAVYRPNGMDYELKFFSIIRDEYVDYAVIYKKADADVDPTGKTGIIKITSFNHTTPYEFDEAMEALKAQGCDRFVFDLRGNPGGEVSSIVALLSRFLDDGTLLFTKKDNQGNVSTVSVGVAEDNPDSDIDCPISAQDIGKYKGVNCVVLCDEGSASAAEIFVANFRDYNLAPIIGTTTYGKGTVQQYLSLQYYGISGVLKMTKYKYFPPCGEGYDGIGIAPDVTVELSDEAKRYSSYELLGKSVDNQLMEAVKYFK